MLEIALVALVFAMLLWIASGAVRVLLGDRRRFGRLDPMRGALRSRRPRRYALGTIAWCGGLALIFALTQVSSLHASLVMLGVGVDMVGAVMLLVSGVLIFTADWPDRTPVRVGYSTPRWYPDPTGETDGQWWWNGWEWTEARRPTYAAGRGQQRA